LHSEQKSIVTNSKSRHNPAINYSDKLKFNAELAINKIQIINEDDRSKALKNSKKKLKTSIEEVFGRGRRLPVFSGITVTNDNDTLKK
jgi:hypothetical protein